MKRLLLITESWPPDGSGGVQRPLQFARHLRGFGYRTEVLAVASDSRRFPRDESLLDQVTDIPSRRIPVPRPWTARLPGTPRKWVRTLVGARVPDDLILAEPRFLEAAVDAHRAEPFDAVMTTSPPHSLALVGLALHRRLGLPWVADLRDEWSRNRLRQRSLDARGRTRDRELERQVFAEADRVIVTTHTLGEFVLARTGRDPAAVVVIPNGYDPEDLPREPLHRYRDHLEVTYLGSLSSYRNLEGLFGAIRRIRRDASSFPFRFRFITAAGPARRHFAGATDLLRAGILSIEDYLPHRRALEEGARSDVLLHVLSNAGPEEEPVAGKLFEYIALERPVLFLTSVHGENERILRESGDGIVADLDDVDSVTAALEEIRRRWEERRLSGTSRNRERFARPALAGILARELEAVLG